MTMCFFGAGGIPEYLVPRYLVPRYLVPRYLVTDVPGPPAAAVEGAEQIGYDGGSMDDRGGRGLSR
jgi:hypothetical protein